MNIVVIGNIATGSSAVIDLLSEYSTCAQALRSSYEHTVFIYPNGLCNLRDSLFSTNASCDSQDKDIRLFLDAMNNLYSNDYGFFGGYKRLIGEPFKANYLSFVNSIAHQVKTTSYSRFEKSRFSLLKASAQFLFKTKPNIYGILPKIDHSPFYEFLISQGDFDKCAQIFIKSYFDSCKCEQENSIFDHLFWHDNVNDFSALLPKDTKIIYVERDPRDIYIFYKYFYRRNTTDGYPMQVNDFCTFYLSQRKNALPESINILQVRFEDLVLNYERSVDKIESFCGLRSPDHVNRYRFFDPSISINNIGLYLKKADAQHEIKFIETRLPNYLYEISPDSQNKLSKTTNGIF
jgi:hypothetical protein